MNASTHTPGEWYVLPDPVWRDLHPCHQARYVATCPISEVEATGRGEGHGWHFTNDRDVIICTMPDSPDQKGNAALIAAAPELLAMCQNALEALSGLAESNACMSEFERACIPALQAAIAKATGGDK